MQHNSTSDLISQYDDPLNCIDQKLVTNEQRNQRKIAVSFVIIGIILFTVTALIGGLLESSSGGSGRDSSSGDALGVIWPIFVTLLAPYGLYRLVRLRHYTAKSLRNQLIKDNEELRLHDTKINTEKEVIRKNKWYNHEILSVQSEQSIGILFIKSVVALSALLILGTIGFVVITQGS